ncbi:MAG: 50S ribosomal protein L22 [Candidatus Obscuribacterales bacterium]|nr:50S ribosomal protein L22 [Candidatus Obscuribacterales bacterium]
MHTKAQAKWIRMSPLKVRRVINLIRGKSAGEAYTILKFMPHAAAREVEKVLWSAMHNLINHAATPCSEEQVQSFKVSKVYADQGPTLKRVQPHARGRAFPIKKRITHITIELDDLQ